MSQDLIHAMNSMSVDGNNVALSLYLQGMCSTARLVDVNGSQVNIFTWDPVNQKPERSIYDIRHAPHIESHMKTPYELFCKVRELMLCTGCTPISVTERREVYDKATRVASGNLVLITFKYTTRVELETAINAISLKQAGVIHDYGAAYDGSWFVHLDVSKL